MFTTLTPGLTGIFSLVMMDTDYDKFAVFCSCKTFTVMVKFHEMTCTILKRDVNNKNDDDVTKKVLKIVAGNK